MISLFFRNLFFTVLQPGAVAGLIPWWLLRRADIGWPGLMSWNTVPGALLFVAGLAVTLACVSRFATEGRGTLSPVDPTQQLVSGGLYRFSRNPMYLGVLAMLAGEALFFRYWPLAAYGAGFFVVFHLFILLHEEPRLRRDFGAAYEAYCRKVRRWL